MIEILEACRGLLAYETKCAKLYGLADCTCTTLTRETEMAYEIGECPHQVARAAIAAAEEAPPVNRWRHRKRGSTYVEVGRGHLQISWPVEDMELMVIYRSEHDGSLWARPVSEFEDGRFEAIAAAEGG